MTRPPRLLVAVVSVAWVWGVLGCGDAGPKLEPRPESREARTGPKSEPRSDSRAEKSNTASGNQQPRSKTQGGAQGIALAETDPTVGDEPEQLEQEARDKQRREELRKKRSEEDAKRAKEETAYRAAKAEFDASGKLRFGRFLASSSKDEREKGNSKEADRLEREARAEYEAITKSFPDTPAARDARDLLLGKRLPDRASPPNPDDAKSIPPQRLADATLGVDLALLEDWGSPLRQIPATVIDKGVLKHVPYQSFRAGDYEFNVYGDPDHPACLEIGVGNALLKSASAKERCVAFMAALLKDPGDRVLLKSLKTAQDAKKRGGLTFEVTPETAADAYGWWWVSVYDTAVLDKSRASAQELAAITTPSKPPPSSGTATAPTWSSQELSLARPGGGTVFVRGYTRKDGTYVRPHTRSAPGSGGSRKK